jgi:hypothetical protein
MNEKNNQDYFDEIQQSLEEGIQDAILEIREKKITEGCKSLSRLNPTKVAKVLHLTSLGVSQSSMVRHHNLNRSTIISVLMDYADYMGKFRELGGKLSGRSYLNLESLEEDIVEALRRKMDEGYVPEFKDLKEVSIAKTNSHRQAMTARGEVSKIVEERKIVSQEDYEDTLKAARERLAKLKQVENVEVING